MNNVSASILINRPIQQVFDYTVLPQNGIHFIPHLKENNNIKPLQAGIGQTFDWVYSVAGIPMKGSAKVVVYNSPHQFVLSTTGEIISTWTFSFKNESNEVKVTLTIDYTFEQNSLKKIVNRLFINTYNEKAVQDTLENLKVQLES